MTAMFVLSSQADSYVKQVYTCTVRQEIILYAYSQSVNNTFWSECFLELNPLIKLFPDVVSR